jgi:copper resistance protein C
MVPVTHALLRWLVLSALAVAPCVAAHAFLDHATPAAGSSVHVPPTSIKLWFSEPLEPAFSKIEVADKTGRRVDKGDARVDRVDRKLLQVSLPRLAAGKYDVTWRVLSVDTHVATGQLSFQVAP